MPLYKKGHDKYRVRIWTKGKPQEWVIEGTKKDAEAFEARKRVEIEQNGPQETRTAPRFSDFCVTKYRPHAEKHLKARTWTNRQYTLATLIAFFGTYKLTDITTELAESYQNARLKLGIAASTVNDEVKVLRAIINHAHYLNVPATKLRIKDLPVRKKQKLHFWTSQQVAKLLDAITEHAPSIYWLVLFLLETGCRRGEGIALRFQDIDFQRAVVRIQPSEEWQPKDNEPREIPLDPNGVLFAWLKDEATSKRPFVFVNRKKEAFVFWPQRKFDRARIAAGFVKSCQHCKVTKKGHVACAEHGITGGPHTTRHTFATHFLAKVPDLYLLAEILGHSHTKVTELYAHLLPDHLERARGAVRFSAPVGVAEMEARGFKPRQKRQRQQLAA